MRFWVNGRRGRRGRGPCGRRTNLNLDCNLSHDSRDEDTPPPVNAMPFQVTPELADRNKSPIISGCPLRTAPPPSAGTRPSPVQPNPPTVSLPPLPAPPPPILAPWIFTQNNRCTPPPPPYFTIPKPVRPSTGIGPPLLPLLHNPPILLLPCPIPHPSRLLPHSRRPPSRQDISLLPVLAPLPPTLHSPSLPPATVPPTSCGKLPPAPRFAFPTSPHLSHSPRPPTTPPYPRARAVSAPLPRSHVPTGTAPRKATNF
jgi:hypothetical protein